MQIKNLIITAAVALVCVALPSHAEDLMEIYRLALTNDPTYKAAEAERKAIYESEGFATANYLPKLNLTASASHSESDYQENPTIEADNTNYGVNLTQPIYNRSYSLTSDKTDSRIEQADLNFLATKQELIVRVANRYFDVLSAIDNVEFSKAEKESIGRQLEQTKQRFEVGLVAITDVHEAQARYDLSIANGIASENQLDNSKESLRTITGEYHQQLAALGERTLFVGRPDPDDIDSWTDTALNQNPYLQSIRLNVDIARYDLKLERANYYPTLNLSANWNSSETEGPVTDFTYDNTGNITGQETTTQATTTDTASVRLDFSLNLYSGGRTNAAVRQANHYLTQSLENMERQRRSVQQDVRNSYLGVISGISQVKALKQAVVSNESALQAAEAGFEVGTRTTVDVLDARRRLFSAKNDLAQARYNYVLSWLGLKQAAGTLEEEDLKKVNEWLQQ